MSYQIKMTSGIEIMVIGNVSRVYDSIGQPLFVGNYEEALDWCDKRAIRTVASAARIAREQVTS